MGVKLTKALGLNRDAPMPPRFAPKVRIKVANDRTKQICEFEMEVPLDGYIADMFPLVEKLRHVLEIQGLMPKSEKPNDDQATGP